MLVFPKSTYPKETGSEHATLAMWEHEHATLAMWEQEKPDPKVISEAIYANAIPSPINIYRVLGESKRKAASGEPCVLRGLWHPG